MGLPSMEMDKNGVKPEQRDPYEVLDIPRHSSEKEIKSAYRKMALKYHPDKNGSDIEAAAKFQEITFAYNVLSDPEKRHQYDSFGFEAMVPENQELEVDLSSLGAVNTIFAALFSKLGVPIKTTISPIVLEEALHGIVTVRALQLGQSLSRKVEKQCAHFYSVSITEEEAQSGIICRVQSADRSKFKLLYFEEEDHGGLALALHEDSMKTGNVTSAGMYFLRFPVYRLDQTINSIAVTRDPEAAFFKKLDGFQPCEITELRAGTHFFAVYGDNFFKSAGYTIETLCAAPFQAEKQQLRAVEELILAKRVELSKFETEYREVLALFSEMTSRYTSEMQAIDELLKERCTIHASYTAASPLKHGSGNNKYSLKGPRCEAWQRREKKCIGKDRPKKKRWYNIHLKVDKKMAKTC